MHKQATSMLQEHIEMEGFFPIACHVKEIDATFLVLVLEGGNAAKERNILVSLGRVP